MKWAFVNNEFIEEEKPVLKTGDLAFQRGYAAFDFFRTHKGRPLFLTHYLDRFFNSIGEMFIRFPYSRSEVEAAIQELIARNGLSETGIKLIATGGYAPDGYTPVQGNFVMQQQGISLPSQEQFEQGLKI